MIDRASPIELHAQIAHELRYRIAAGTLAPGTRLPSLREGARIWGANYHTVRRAYRELARVGLVEINGPTGTRVADASVRLAEGEGLGAFVDEIVARCGEDHGLTLEELILLLRNHGSARSNTTVSVVECNREQAGELAEQVETTFDVAAAPHVLSHGGPAPRGIILGTLFHRVEMLERWPHLRPAMRFLPIHPDPDFVKQVLRSSRGRMRSAPLFARNAGAAAAMASDVGSLFADDEIEIVPEVLTPTGRLPRVALSRIALVHPVDWAALPSSQREHPRVMRVPYRFDRFRLGAVAQDLGWRSSSSRDRAVETCPYAVETSE